MDHVGSSQAQPQVEPTILDEEEFRSTAEWQLNASCLFGEVRDGVPPRFTQAETEFMLTEGAKKKVRYNPSPGAKQKAYQQKRTAHWRVNQRQ